MIYCQDCLELAEDCECKDVRKLVKYHEDENPLVPDNFMKDMMLVIDLLPKLTDLNITVGKTPNITYSDDHSTYCDCDGDFSMCEDNPDNYADSD